MQDSGLFISMLDRDCAAKILSGDLGFYKGAIFENIIADSFSKQDKKLYYFHKDSEKNATRILMLQFILERQFCFSCFDNLCLFAIVAYF